MRIIIACSFVLFVGIVFGSIEPKSPINQLKERAYWKNLVDGKLISHGKYICLEKQALSKEELSLMTSIELEEKPTGSIDFYELNEPLKARYEQLIGKSVVVNNPLLGSTEAKIEGLFLISDLWNEEVYVAAEFSYQSKDIGFYYGYASVEMPDSKASFSLEDQVQLFQEKVSQEAFYLSFDTLKNHQDTEYEEVEVMEVSWGDRSFVVVQNRFVGVCGSIVASQVFVYEKVAKTLEIRSHFTTDDYVHGLIDTDHDGVMEIVLVSFASSGIYELHSETIVKKETLSWSFEGCPC